MCFNFSFFMFILSMMVFMMSLFFMMMDFVIMLEYEILSLNSSMICFSVLFDWMSLLFMSFVMFISSMVIYYSNDYMEGDVNLNRFIYLIYLFVVSMMFLIISPNLISILLGWDGLGLISYCLVIYYQNLKSSNAGMLTALSNRIGDVLILISIAWMMNYGSWNFIFYLDFMQKDFNMIIVCYLIILACLTKSAQIPFSSWLPAAMAAPTPVSSLVHSSTLVTAGVYLLIRFSACFDSSMIYFLMFISLLTMFMSSMCANFEYDLKKIIALSTLSQLGLMILIMSLGDSSLAFFHLLSHALFKALLFMCSGSIIHNLSNCQDIRFMGSVILNMPLTCLFFNISNFSLCGFPFLAGFYSKDLILDIYSMKYLNMFVYMLMYISMGMTIMYSVRLSYYMLFNVNLNFSYSKISDQSKVMVKSMMGLYIGVLFSGSILSWLIFPSPYFISLPFFMKIMILMFTFMGLLFGYELNYISINYKLLMLKYMNFTYFFSSMWNLPMLSTWGINFYPLKLGNYYYSLIDLGWSEKMGTQGLNYLMYKNSNFFQSLSKNELKINLIIFSLWVFIILICF
uniref:NADH-ubiquinone oxidoreductase chain 5 n=1 Tax=Lamprigera yunnana TaxID=370605 RepID=A0A1Y0BT72_9COLE|nr:NADH dehydrogenase subunit 5 [Lamprigera yunnana]